MALIGEKAIDIVDIKEYVGVVLKRKWLVLACFIVSLGTMTVILQLQPATFTATARIHTQAGMALTRDVGLREERVRNVVANAVDTLMSEKVRRETLTRVIPKLRLSANIPPIEVQNRYIKKAQAVNRRGTSFITLEVVSINPEFARYYANDWANVFLELREKQRKQTIEEGTAKLKDAIQVLEMEIREAKQKLENFRVQNKLSNLNELGNIAAKRLQDLYAQLDSVYNERIRLEAEEPYVAKNPNYLYILQLLRDRNVVVAAQPADEKQAGDTHRDAAGAPESQPVLAPSTSAHYFELQKQRGLILAQMESARNIYKDKHPVMVKLREQLGLVDLQIAQEVEFALQQFRTRIGTLKAREERLRKEIAEREREAAEAKAKISEHDAMLASLNALEKRRDEQKALKEKIEEEQKLFSDSFTLVEEAKESIQTGPRFRTGILLAAFIGLGLGIVLAFFIEYVDDSIKVAEEVERDLKLPFLGMVPSAHWAPEDLKAHMLHKLSQQSSIAESYRMVRSALLFAAPKEKIRTIQITSAVPLEGKTTTALNLAIGLAQAGEKVLLVDCDLRRGELHKYFDFQKENGLSDVLRGEKTPDEVVRHTEVDNLDLVCSGAYPTNPAELLLSTHTKEFLEWARTRYDRIFIDCPPAMGISDTVILGALVDGLVLVVWAGHTSRRLVRAAKESLLARGANVIGFILNNLDIGRVGYYYYYPYYYSYYYTYSSYGPDKGKRQQPQPTPQQPEDVY